MASCLDECLDVSDSVSETLSKSSEATDVAKESAVDGLNHNGHPIPMWSVTAQEYIAMERFPELVTKRFETGFHCLTLKERFKLLELADSLNDIPPNPVLHDKVSLLVGGNIVHVSADAVVNTSNVFLTSGKGVNGAIHAWAGDYLQMECAEIGWCRVGEAKITDGYNLPAKRIIHTVGPKGEDKSRAEKLRCCYTSCLNLCLTNNIKTIVFPCISTGQYSYPSVEAGNVACRTIRQWLLDHSDKIDRIIFITRTARDEEVYATLMLKYFPLDNQ